MMKMKFPQLIIIMHIERLGMLWTLEYHGQEWKADQSLLLSTLFDRFRLNKFANKSFSIFSENMVITAVRCHKYHRKGEDTMNTIYKHHTLINILMNDEKSPRHQFSLMLMTFPFSFQNKNQWIIDWFSIAISPFTRSLHIENQFVWKYYEVLLIIPLASSIRYLWKEAKLKIFILAKDRCVQCTLDDIRWSMDPSQCAPNGTKKRKSKTIDNEGKSMKTKSDDMALDESSERTHHISCFVKWNNKSIHVFQIKKEFCFSSSFRSISVQQSLLLRCRG